MLSWLRMSAPRPISQIEEVPIPGTIPAEWHRHGNPQPCACHLAIGGTLLGILFLLVTNDGGSALTEKTPAPGAGHRLPSPAAGLSHARFAEGRAQLGTFQSGSRGAARVLSAGSGKWQMQDREMQGAIFFAQIRTGRLLSRKCSIWCRKLLFIFNSTCARQLLASRWRWHGSSEPARQLGASPALASGFLRCSCLGW